MNKQFSTEKKNKTKNVNSSVLSLNVKNLMGKIPAAPQTRLWRVHFYWHRRSSTKRQNPSLTKFWRIHSDCFRNFSKQWGTNCSIPLCSLPVITDLDRKKEWGKERQTERKARGKKAPPLTGISPFSKRHSSNKPSMTLFCHQPPATMLGAPGCQGAGLALPDASGRSGEARRRPAYTPWPQPSLGNLCWGKNSPITHQGLAVDSKSFWFGESPN